MQKLRGPLEITIRGPQGAGKSIMLREIKRLLVESGHAPEKVHIVEGRDRAGTHEIVLVNE